MSQTVPQTQQTRRVEADVKKVDYTIQNYEDENDLAEELREIADDPDRSNREVGKVLDELDKYNAPIKPIIHIKARGAGGTRIPLRVHGARPYFYVPDDEFEEELEEDDKVTGIDKGHENVQGERMVKVFTRIPGDVPKLRDDYDHHEADILFPNRFMIDAGIEGSITIPHTHATAEPTDIHVDQIGDANYDQDSRVCYCDIEVDDSKGFPDQGEAKRRVISITVYDNYIEDYQIFMYDPDFRDVSHGYAKVRQFDNEVDMLHAFMEYIHTRDFDAIAGWNFTDFDSRYLVNRLDYLNNQKGVEAIEKSDLSPLGSAYDDGWFGAKIKGIAVFDLLRAYKNLQFTELDSFSLEDVAQAELGTGKVEHQEDVYTLWEEKPQQLVEYNVKDVELTVRLDEEQQIIKFYEEIANYVGGRVAECVDASKAVDIKILRAVNGKFAVPSSKNVDGEAFEGAEVFDPITGVKENVIVLDLASLYPMSMKTINAGPATKDPNGELVAPNGVRFSNDKDAIVVKIIDELLETRQEYKDLRDQHPPDSKQYNIYDMKQTAVKVVMNCFSRDTEVLTPDGIKNIKNLSVGDDVYSINPDTSEIEIKEVVNTIQQDNEYGRLEHIDTNNTDLKITPNHRMVVDEDDGARVQHFNDLNKGVNYTIPVHSGIDGDKVEERNIIDDSKGRFWIDIDIHGNSFRNICPNGIYYNLSYSRNRTKYSTDDKQVVKDLIELHQERKKYGTELINNIGVQYGDKHSTIPVTYNMNDWLELLGWVISEGSFNSVESKQSDGVSYRGQSDRVQIAQKKSEYRTNIVDLVDRMGLNYSNDGNGVYLYNSNMYQILKDSVGCDSHNKRIPQWVFDYDMPASQLKHLLFSLIDGDGDKTGKESYRYSTVSEQLKDDVMKLAVLCGYKVSFSEDSDIYRVYINKNKGSFTKGQNTESEEYNGKVYCVEVEDNHTLMAGRNGKFQWTGNTLYGVMGWDRFRLYDEDVGSAVTAVGREVIKFTEQVVEEMGYEVTYGDTDSVMIELGSDVTKEEAMEIAFGMEEHINNRYDDFAKEELNADEHFFDIEFEKLYRRYFQAGKKKRYAGHIIWKEGKDKDSIDTVGFETERSDYSKAAKDILERTLEIIVRGGDFEDVSDHVRGEIEKLRNEEYDVGYWGIPSSIGKDFDDYDSPTLPVRASEYANEELDAGIQPDDKPKMMYVDRVLPDEDGNMQYNQPPKTGEGVGAVCWMNFADIPDCFKWDWDAYVDKQIKGPMKRVLLGTDWTWTEVISGEIQPGLGSFDSNTVDDEAQVVEASFSEDKNEGPFEEDFNDRPPDGRSISEHEAKQALAHAQEFLEHYEEEECDDAEVIEADMKDKEEGPTTLNQYW